MLVTSEEIASYKKNGFIILRGFFPKETIAQIFTDVKEVFALQFEKLLDVPLETALAMTQEEFTTLMIDLYKKDFNVFSNCSKQVQHLVSLHELGVSKKLVEVLKELGLTKPILSVRACVLMNNLKLDKDGEKGKYWRLPPHQDWYYSQGSLDSVTVWTPYVFCNAENGALQFIPGSHLWGLQKTNEGAYGELSEEPDDSKFVSYDMDTGDLLVFVSLLVHRSGVNSTNRVRWSTQFQFSNLLEPTFIERSFPNPFVYHPTRVLETPGFPGPDELKKTFG